MRPIIFILPLPLHWQYAAPYGQSPSNLPHEIDTQHTLRPLIHPPHVLSPHRYHCLPFFPSRSSSMLPPSMARPTTAADLNTPPPPSLNNQTPTTLFQPSEDPDHDLGDEGDSPLLRVLIRTSAMVEYRNASHGSTRL